MANRSFYDGVKTLYPKIVEIVARVTFGAAGAPTLDSANSRGVLSVTRNAAGKLTFVFGVVAGGANRLDNYVKTADVRATFDTSGVSGGPLPPAAPTLAIYADNVSTTGTASIQVALMSVGTTPTLTDPASGEVGHFRFLFLDTTAG